MSERVPQNLKNHASVDPVFHYFLVTVLLLNLALVIVHLVRHPSFVAAWLLVLSLAAIAAATRVRMYPMKVQDRVIRLEERLRLQALAPEEWHAQIYRLSEDQLIGLRSAADDEVVQLAKQALEHNWDRKQIKERIQNWRPDYLRV